MHYDLVCEVAGDGVASEERLDGGEVRGGMDRGGYADVFCKTRERLVYVLVGDCLTYAVLARKHPSHVCARARGEPDGTPILLRDCTAFGR